MMGVVPFGERQIVFSSNRRTEARYLSDLEVYSLNLETGKVVNLSAGLVTAPFADGSRPDTTELFSLARYRARHGEEPTLSPDRTKVAFVSYRDGNHEIYVMGADGRAPTNITQHDARITILRGRPTGGGSPLCRTATVTPTKTVVFTTLISFS